MCFERGLPAPRCAGLDEAAPPRALCSVLRKWLPTAACSTSLTRFCIVPTIEITFGARVSGTWICTCRSMLEHEAFAALRLDRRQLRVEVVRRRLTASAQLSVRIDVGTISAA